VNASQISIDNYYRRIAELVTHPINLMEVCGTHTVAISRNGIRARLPKHLRLLSGPGCPVCVTPTAIVDTLIELSRLPNVVISTFGDMLRVPGSSSSLHNERSHGATIQTIYSPLDAIEFAQTYPDKKVVLAAVGFETTLPVLAATLIRVKSLGLKNFFAVPSGRLAPPAMAALMQSNEVRIDGFICPGHVSTIIGTEPYEFLANEYHVPCVITGFEAIDILTGITMLLEQVSQIAAKVENEYERAVSNYGNTHAKEAIEKVFRTTDAEWRGIGMIPDSGVVFNEDFMMFDAVKHFAITPKTESSMPAGCQCGEIMRGIKLPHECPLFGTACIPSHPVGPCMVSSEGSCAAYYRYGERG
jgi:hydrogenase expression/formation protein HypD